LRERHRDLLWPGRAHLSEILLYTAFLLLGLLAACHPMILTGLTLVQTDPGDTRFNNYILEHGYQWLTNNSLHRSFWDPPMFFPARNTAAFSDILLGSAPIYWLCRFCGFYWDTSLQLWMMTVLALNYLLAIILLRRELGLSALSAIAGAYIFAFAGIRVSQLGHQQLLPQFFSLVAVLALIKVFKPATHLSPPSLPKSNFWIPVFFLAFVLQFYAGFYLGWFFAFGLLIFFLIALFFQASRRQILQVAQGHYGMILVSILLAAAALSWMGWHYLLSSQTTGHRPWWELATMIPRLTSWIDMGPDNWLYRWTRTWIDFNSIPLEHEHRIGLGVLTGVAALAGLIMIAKTTWGRVTALTFLVIALAALDFYGWSPWKLVYNIFPGARSIRGVARIALLLLIFFSLGIAFFCEYFKRRKLLLLILLIIMCLEQIQTTSYYDKIPVRDRIHRIAQKVTRDFQAFYYLPLQDNTRESFDIHQIDAMWVQMVAQVPTINGFSGWHPHPWLTFFHWSVTATSNVSTMKSIISDWLSTQGLKSPTLVPVETDEFQIYGLSRPQKP
jgi:hypothetical protein